MAAVMQPFTVSCTAATYYTVHAVILEALFTEVFVAGNRSFALRESEIFPMLSSLWF